MVNLAPDTLRIIGELVQWGGPAHLSLRTAALVPCRCDEELEAADDWCGFLPGNERLRPHFNCCQ